MGVCPTARKQGGKKKVGCLATLVGSAIFISCLTMIIVGFYYAYLSFNSYYFPLLGLSPFFLATIISDIQEKNKPNLADFIDHLTSFRTTLMVLSLIHLAFYWLAPLGQAFAAFQWQHYPQKSIATLIVYLLLMLSFSLLKLISQHYFDKKKGH